MVRLVYAVINLGPNTAQNLWFIKLNLNIWSTFLPRMKTPRLNV